MEDRCMIDTKKKLKECLDLEEKLYRDIGYKGKLHGFITQCEVAKIYRFLEILRKDEFYTNTCKGIIGKFRSVYYRRLHNKLGIQLGISIPVNVFKTGLLIYHSQGIIVHRDAKCGKYCKLHGFNCIGNNGRENGDSNAPIIGDYVDIGVGASIIGAVEIASDVKIAAHALVCKSCSEEGSVLIGVPAEKKV